MATFPQDSLVHGELVALDGAVITKFMWILAVDEPIRRYLVAYGTRTDRTAQQIQKTFGCFPDPAYPCFIIRRDQRITNAGKSFPFDTKFYLNPSAVIYLPFSALGPDSHRDYGVMRGDIRQQLLACIRHEGDLEFGKMKLLGLLEPSA